MATNDILSIHCNRLSHLTHRVIELGFCRSEFYNLSPEDMPIFKRFIRDRGITPSVHCPLRKAPWYPYPVTWSFLTSENHDEQRALSFRLIEESLRDAADIDAAYVVVHYPNPAPASPDQIPLDRQHETAWKSARRLQEMSEIYGVPIYIEGFGPTPFMSPDFLASVFLAYPALRYCFDTGHIALMAQRDGLNYFGFLEAIAPYIGCVHVWNTRGMADYERYHHLPPHPALKPSDGWVDIERVVAKTRAANPAAVFVLEYTHDMPPEFGLNHAEGIAWFKELVTAAGPDKPGCSNRQGCVWPTDTDLRNIVLTGFMGAGKTQVGKVIASRLGRPFVDMDDVLEARFEMSIPAVFQTLGEAAFREAEARLCVELASQQGLVVSTGGGALVPEANRRAFEHTGIVICLTCAPETIVQRIGQDPNRPMLQGDDLGARIDTLLARRKSAYDAVAHHVDTTNLTVEQVADAVLDLWGKD